jgi:nicotinamidase-related amidase
MNRDSTEGVEMKKGLILVDIQNDYFPGGNLELKGMKEAASVAGDLLRLFRDKAWPLFHVQHLSNYDGATFFLPDTPGVQIHETVKPLPGETVIRKHFPNSFRKTSLLDKIQEAGVEAVVICGAMSHLCIDATTRAAADLGFPCNVIHDGCATRDLDFRGRTVSAADVHAAFMAALGSGYARVMDFNTFQSKA